MCHCTPLEIHYEVWRRVQITSSSHCVVPMCTFSELYISVLLSCRSLVLLSPLSRIRVACCYFQELVLRAAGVGFEGLGFGGLGFLDLSPPRRVGLDDVELGEPEHPLRKPPIAASNALWRGLQFIKLVCGWGSWNVEIFLDTNIRLASVKALLRQSRSIKYFPSALQSAQTGCCRRVA